MTLTRHPHFPTQNGMPPNYQAGYRNNALDIAKGLGIILVVIGHNWIILNEEKAIIKVIYAFHMPFFFFMSGVFLRKSVSTENFILNRFQSLLKPYFSTLLIIGGLKLTFDAIKTNSFPSSTFKHVAGIFYATGSTIDWTPMWFLPHLFISTLVAMLFIKTVRSKLAMALLAISLLTVGVRYLTPDDLPWSLDLIPISLPFILAGYICRDYTQKIRFQLPYFLISALLFCVLQVYFDETTDFNLRIYTNVFVNTLQALLGIYICLAASSFLVRYLTVSKALSYIGSSSIFILIFHGFFQSKVLHLMMKNSVTPVPSILISLTAGIAFPLLIWEIANRSQILKRLLLPKRSNTS